MTERIQAKPLVEGALLAALTVLLATINFYLPIPFLSLALPVPIIILVFRQNLNLGIMAAVVAAFLSGILAGGIGQTVLVLVSGAVGLALGEAMRQQFSPSKVLLIGTLAALIFGAAMIGLLIWVTGVNNIRLYIDEMFKALQQSSDQVVKLYTRLGMGKAQLDQLKAMQKNLTAGIRLLLPSLPVMMAAVQAGASYWLARKVLLRLGNSVPGFPAFDRWRFPRYMVAGFLLSWLLQLGTSFFPHREIFIVIVANIYVAFLMVFFLQGLSVVWFYLNRYKASGIVKVLVVFFGASFPLAEMILVWIGVMDGWLNYRRLGRS